MSPHESIGEIHYTFEPDPDVKLKGGIVLMPDHRVSHYTHIEPKFDGQGLFDLGKEVAAAIQAFCDKLGLAAVYFQKSMIKGHAEICDLFFKRYVNNPDPAPYAPEVFDRIKSMKAHIEKASDLLGKDKCFSVGIAGSIADEFNTYRGKDILQDFLSIKGLLVALTKGIKGSSLEGLLRRFSHPIDLLGVAGEANPALGWSLKLLPEDSRKQQERTYLVPAIISPSWVEKLTNARANDLGIGNIQLGTAMDSWKEFHGLDSQEVRQMTEEKMAEYLNTPEGAAKVAAIILHLAQIKLEAKFAKAGLKFPENDKIMVAFLVSIYKQGHQRFLGNVQTKLDEIAELRKKGPIQITLSPDKGKIIVKKTGKKTSEEVRGWKVNIEAGEGKRVIHQWEVFKKIFPDC